MKTTKSNPWAAMDAIVNANPEPVGEEWFTVGQYAKRYECSLDAAANKLSRMKETGIVEKWKGMSVLNRNAIITKWRVKPVSCHS